MTRIYAIEVIWRIIAIQCLLHVDSVCAFWHTPWSNIINVDEIVFHRKSDYLIYFVIHNQWRAIWAVTLICMQLVQYTGK